MIKLFAESLYRMFFFFVLGLGTRLWEIYDRYSCLEILGPVWAMSRVSNFQSPNINSGNGAIKCQNNGRNQGWFTVGIACGRQTFLLAHETSVVRRLQSGMYIFCVTNISKGNLKAFLLEGLTYKRLVHGKTFQFIKWKDMIS